MTNVGDLIKCPVCGREFLLDRPNRRYCSKECASKSYKYVKRGAQVKICEFCGKEYTAKNANRKYCSGECNRKVCAIRRKEGIRSCRVKEEKAEKGAHTKINLEVDRIEVLAERENLSYGQYVAKYGL